MTENHERTKPRSLDEDPRFQGILEELRTKHGSVVTENELRGLAEEEFLYQFPVDAREYGIRISQK